MKYIILLIVMSTCISCSQKQIDLLKSFVDTDEEMIMSEPDIPNDQKIECIELGKIPPFLKSYIVYSVNKETYCWYDNRICQYCWKP